MTMKNNIALVKLDTPLNFSSDMNNNFIAPICLPPAMYKSLDNAMGMVSGWSGINHGEYTTICLLLSKYDNFFKPNIQLRSKQSGKHVMQKVLVT